jgi:HEAT repeats
MDSMQKSLLVKKYNDGLADAHEVAELEKLIEAGELEIEQLHEIQAINNVIMKMDDAIPSPTLDERFNAALAKEKKSMAKALGSFSWNGFFQWSPRLNFATAMLLVGLLVGYSIHFFQPNTEVKKMSAQINEMRELMMLALLEKESATDRLKAVSLSDDLEQASRRVTDALIQVLNTDPNVNVRLATLDALVGYTKDPPVRMQLVKSISFQDSPLVQIALAELMVALNEKSSVSELKKVMEGKTTPKEVKEKLRESVNVLI